MWHPLIEELKTALDERAEILRFGGDTYQKAFILSVLNEVIRSSTVVQDSIEFQIGFIRDLNENDKKSKIKLDG